jgi:hypothetical protein
MVLPEMRRGAPGLKLPSAPRMVPPSAYNFFASLDLIKDRDHRTAVVIFLDELGKQMMAWHVLGVAE